MSRNSFPRDLEGAADGVSRRNGTSRLRPACHPEGMTSLAGKVALVTGGATGIGAAIAEAYASAGASVAVTGRRPDPLASVAARISAAGGQRAGRLRRCDPA